MMGSFKRLCVRTMRRLGGIVLDAALILTRRKDTFLPPPELVTLVGGGDFEAAGDEFFHHLTGIGGLLPNYRVLEVGCGCGRMAIPFIHYFTGRGRYYGFDVSRECVVWCTRHISRKSNRFRFFHVDVKNGLYNPDGKLKPENYVFPFPDEFLDFVFLTSVFTHMRPEAIKSYLLQIGRVFKPGGRCFSTFFLIDDKTRELLRSGSGDYSFRHRFSEFYADRDDVLEAAVAYDERYMRECLRQKNFRILEPIHFGSWRGHNQGVSFQDIVCFRKPDPEDRAG
jgi:SAM-dependent methyltransferase